VVLFLDAAHFVHSVYTGFLWCFTRLFVPSNSGRQRWNVLAALDAVSLKVHSVCNNSYINSESVCELLTQLRKFYETRPITIFLDNAKYQKCKLVQECAMQLKIELAYIPSYSPNLNLIERFWKHVRKECLYSKFYSSFSEFKQSICSCIDQSDTKHKTKLNTLLAWNFQLFNKVKVLTV